MFDGRAANGGGGAWPPMEELKKHWMKEVEERVEKPFDSINTSDAGLNTKAWKEIDTGVSLKDGNTSSLYSNEPSSEEIQKACGHGHSATQLGHSTFHPWEARQSAPTGSMFPEWLPVSGA